MVKESPPWHIETVKIVRTKHFEQKYLSKWHWGPEELRDAVRRTYRIEQVGKSKYELYTYKTGFKKIILVYENGEIICISGAEGGKRS